MSDAHNIRDNQTGIYRRDVHIINLRVIDDNVNDEVLSKIARDFGEALKRAGLDQQYIVVATPPGIIMDVEWAETFLKKVADATDAMRNATFTENLSKGASAARQKRWGAQTPPEALR